MNTQLKIAIYSPYLDTAGGGEKYILTLAEYLSKNSNVEVLLDDHLASLEISSIKDKLVRLHGLDLSQIKFIKAPIGQGSNFFERIFFLRKYDWLFYLTDGSIFYSTAKKSVIHFQVPFTKELNGGMWQNLKKSSWNLAIYNSLFTRKYVEKVWNISSKVIYPPISIETLKPLTKKKQILSVGRFFGYLKDKKHQLMIETFKKMIDQNKLKNWSLHLVGSATQGDQEYLNQLKQLSTGYDIHFYPNAPLKQLTVSYGEATIYWHASGYEEEDPKKFEHFGMALVEAMAAGAVPVVINKGGLTEIVSSEVDGFLWNTSAECIKSTMNLINDSKLCQQFSLKAQQKSERYSKSKFIEEINKLVYE